MRVAEDLHFDVPRLANQLLEVHLVVAEAGLGLAARHGQQLCQLRIVLDDAHAAAATAPARLEHHRVAHFGRLLLAGFHVGRQRRCGRHHRHQRLRSQVARGHLVAQRAHDLGRGPHEDDAFAIAGFHELGVLGKKSITGMDRIDLGFDRDAQDVLDVEVRVHGRLAAAHQVGLVGLGPVQGEAVFLRVDRDGADAQLVGGAHDADGDLTAIRDEQALDASQHGSLSLLLSSIVPDAEL